MRAKVKALFYPKDILQADPKETGHEMEVYGDQSEVSEDMVMVKEYLLTDFGETLGHHEFFGSPREDGYEVWSIEDKT